jgi:hypothetical protein
MMSRAPSDCLTSPRGPQSPMQPAHSDRSSDGTARIHRQTSAWLADPANRSDRYGRYTYTLEPYGLSVELLEGSFDDYRRRFRLGPYTEHS